MNGKEIDPSIPIINQLEVGDEVSVSTRKTDMEITDIETNEKRVYAHLILENQHGVYKLIRSELGDYEFCRKKTNDEGTEHWVTETADEPIEIELA